MVVGEGFPVCGFEVEGGDFLGIDCFVDDGEVAPAGPVLAVFVELLFAADHDVCELLVGDGPL